MILFLNGEFIELAQARITPSDRGLTLGDGVFDTLLAVDGVLQYGPRHFQRLLSHAAHIRIPVPYDAAMLDDTARALLRHNGAGQGSFSVRTTVTRGAAARGLLPPDEPSPTVMMQVAPLPAPADNAQGITVITARHVRRNEHSPLSRIKSLNYGDNLSALMEAHDAGCADAVMLNTAGRAACGTTGNLFILEGDTLVTPFLSEGAMNGIMREVIAAACGAREDLIAPERLAAADGIYLTNSLRGVRPVTALDGKPVGSLNDFYRDIARRVTAA